MGLIKGWIDEMGDMWGRMSAGDPTAFLGLPRQQTGTGGGTGPGSGPPGTGPGSGPPGTGTGGPPSGTGPGSGPPGSLTEHQRQMLMKFFHQQYGRYPQSEYEFQQWLRDNW